MEVKQKTFSSLCTFYITLILWHMNKINEKNYLWYSEFSTKLFILINNFNYQNYRNILVYLGSEDPREFKKYMLVEISRKKFIFQKQEMARLELGPKSKEFFSLKI